MFSALPSCSRAWWFLFLGGIFFQIESPFLRGQALTPTPPSLWPKKNFYFFRLPLVLYPLLQELYFMVANLLSSRDSTVCLKTLVPLCIVTYHIKWAKSSRSGTKAIKRIHNTKVYSKRCIGVNRMLSSRLNLGKSYI